MSKYSICDYAEYIPDKIVRSVEVYTDGSYQNSLSPDKVYGAAVILINGIAVQAYRYISKNAAYVSGQSNGGELLAAGTTCIMMFALLDEMAGKGFKTPEAINIYHDYTGVAAFIVAPQGQRHPWVARKPSPLLYTAIMRELQNKFPTVVKFHWVKGHSGNKWNAYADMIASGTFNFNYGFPIFEFDEDKLVATYGDNNESR